MADPSERLLRLLSLLQRRPRWTGPELADALQTTTRTVRRDIDRLRRLGYTVDAAPGPDGGYRLAVGAEVPPLLFDDDEAVAVAVALGISTSHSSLAVGEAALSALAKLDRLLPPRVRRRVAVIGTSTDALSSTANLDGAVQAASLVSVAQGIDARERIGFDYVDREGNRTDRRVEPHRLVTTHRRWYLLAFDLDRGDWRVFRLDRLQRVSLLGHRFDPRPHPDARTMVSQAISSSPYRHQAVVRFDTAAKRLRERIPASVGTVESAPGGGAILRVGSDHLSALAGHLVGLDLPFEVLEPIELRDHVHRIGRAMVAAHRGRA